MSDPTVFSLWRGHIPARRSMPEMAQEVAEIYGVTVEDITGPSRIGVHCRQRFHFMWLAYQQPHLSLFMIGQYLGGRDHTTVVHGIKRHEALRALDAAA